MNKRTQLWRDEVTHVTIDLSASYAKAARETLPRATLVADRFHLVALGNAMLTAVRQRVTREATGHRGRKPDLTWRSRRRLITAVERLSDQQRERLQSGPDRLFTQIADAGIPEANRMATTIIDKQPASVVSDPVNSLQPGLDQETDPG